MKRIAIFLAVAMMAMFLVGPGVAQAQVLFLESFNRTGTLSGSSPDISPGSPQTWVNGNADAVTLNGSQGIWDGDSQPIVNFAAGELLIPSQSSGLSLEVEVRLSAIDGADMDRGEIRLQSGASEHYVPGMGQILSADCVNGEYCIGGWNGGAVTQATGIATPASPNDSHVVRTLIRPTASEVEFVSTLSVNGGAFTDLGTNVRPFSETSGTGPEDAGSFSRLNIVSRAGHGHSLDYVQISQVPEPTSLVVMGLGCLFLGGLPWRRRRRS